MARSGTGSGTRTRQTAAIRGLGVVAVVRVTGRPHAPAPGARRDWRGGRLGRSRSPRRCPTRSSVIRELARTLPAAGLLGAGTVARRGNRAGAAIDAGARFVVSPGFRRALIEEATSARCADDARMFLPNRDRDGLGGGRRHRQGVPRHALGPGATSNLRGPFPAIKVMPTGGVSPENAGDWIRAGARRSVPARRWSTKAAMWAAASASARERRRMRGECAPPEGT